MGNDNQYTILNKPLLAKLLLKAKGPERNMKDFADICAKKLGNNSRGVSASTFSRIANQKIEMPISKELIRVIVDNAAEPGSIDFDEMMRANGMMPTEDQQPLKIKIGAQQEERRRENERNMGSKNIIMEELSARGYVTTIYPNLELFVKLPTSNFGLSRISFFALHIQDYDPLYWNFILCPPQKTEPTSNMVKMSPNILRDSMDRFSPVFLRDAWEPDAFKEMKNTFIFTDRRRFDCFKEMLAPVKVNTWMSALLVDIAEGKVVEEYELKRRGKKTETSLFDKPVVEGDEEYDY